MLKQQSIEAYLSDLASRSPTPGGGAAAAITGAQGVALLAMVCNLTLGKEKFSPVGPEVRTILEKLEKHRSTMLDLAQQDVDVFQAVRAAYQRPKAMPDDLESRKEVIQASLKAASEVPCQLVGVCAEALSLTSIVRKIGNPSVLSDVTVGEHLLVAALLSADANVEANLVSIDDVAFCQSKRSFVSKVRKDLNLSAPSYSARPSVRADRPPAPAP